MRKASCGYGPYDLTILVGFAGSSWISLYIFYRSGGPPLLEARNSGGPDPSKAVEVGRGAATQRPRGRMGNGPHPTMFASLDYHAGGFAVAMRHSRCGFAAGYSQRARCSSDNCNSSLDSKSGNEMGPAVLLPHRRMMLGWGECQAEHRHVQQINRDHCHCGHRYW